MVSVVTEVAVNVFISISVFSVRRYKVFIRIRLCFGSVCKLILILLSISG